MPYWTIDMRNPVVSPGSLHPPFDEGRAGAAHVVALDDGFRMVYWGSGRQGQNYILQAQSPATDPNGWRPLGNALIGPQPDTTHNNQGPGFPFLLPVTDTRWHLYFTAWGTRTDGRLPNTTGLAVSDDRGATWHYHPEHPVIPLDRDYDSQGTGSLWIQRENGKFQMYYTAIGRYFAKPDGVETGHGDTIPEIGIGYAESTDGIHWEKPLDQLLIAPRGFGVTPYEYICSKPCVVKHRDGYIMWVNTFGTAYRVHRLTSTDGLNWKWAERQGPDGELGVGKAGTFDDRQRSYPAIICADDQLHCWFTGNRFGESGMGYAVSPVRIDCGEAGTGRQGAPGDP
ncbi:MAG: hypothetical protein CMN78_05950 [Spirochaetales bacterium]|nr:hypothetical protein [Spirochaetales bacterium]